jgi:hypothetical protein
MQIERREVLLEYLDERLAALLEADSKCTERTRELCQLTFEALSGATDAQISDFRVCAPSDSRDAVEVRFRNFGQPTSLWFDMKKTPAGWRIRDIRYQRGGSLVELLSGN